MINFKVNIGTEDNTWIILRDFSVNFDEDKKGVELFMRLFYTDNEEVNNKLMKF